jgi:hypothetical protein
MPESLAIGFRIAIPDSLAIGFFMAMPESPAIPFFIPMPLDVDDFSIAIAESLAVPVFVLIPASALDESDIVEVCWPSAVAAFAGVLPIVCECSGAAATQIMQQRTTIETQRLIVRYSEESSLPVVEIRRPGFDEVVWLSARDGRPTGKRSHRR